MPPSQRAVRDPPAPPSQRMLQCRWPPTGPRSQGPGVGPPSTRKRLRVVLPPSENLTGRGVPAKSVAGRYLREVPHVLHLRLGPALLLGVVEFGPARELFSGSRRRRHSGPGARSQGPSGTRPGQRVPETFACQEGLRSCGIARRRAARGCCILCNELRCCPAHGCGCPRHLSWHDASFRGAGKVA